MKKWQVYLLASGLFAIADYTALATFMAILSGIYLVLGEAQ